MIERADMAFPSYDDWQAPWEKSGDPMDEDTAKRLIYNLSRKDHDRRSTVRDLRSQMDELQDELDAAEDRASKRDKSRDRRKERNSDDSDAEQDSSASDSAALEVERLRIALEKGLTERQVKRLVGSTVDELREDADAYMQEHGITSDGDKGSEGDDDDEKSDQQDDSDSMRRAPRRKNAVKTGLGGSGDAAPDRSSPKDFLDIV